MTNLLLTMISESSRFAPDELARVDLETFARYTGDMLRDELAISERSEGDWAITGFHQAGCCADCTELATFLTDTVRKQHVWPMAKPRREHIHRRSPHVDRGSACRERVDEFVDDVLFGHLVPTTDDRGRKFGIPYSVGNSTAEHCWTTVSTVDSGDSTLVIGGGHQPGAGGVP